MSVALIAAAAAVEANSIVPPAHQAGDFIVIAAASTGGIIAVPAGWLVLGIRSASGRYLIIAGRHAVSSSEVSGTWTGANLISALVYRDPVNYVGFSGAEDTAATGTAVTYTQIDAVTASTTINQHLPVAAGIFVAAGMVVSNSQALETPPAGYTFRSGIAAAVAPIELAVHDTASEVASIGLVTTAIASSLAYATLVVGLYDSGIPKSGSGSPETSHVFVG